MARTWDDLKASSIESVTPNDEVLRRMVSWLAPGGWLLAEDCDFGMWLAGRFRSDPGRDDHGPRSAARVGQVFDPLS